MKLDNGRERGRDNTRSRIAPLAPESESDQRSRRRGGGAGEMVDAPARRNAARFFGYSVLRNHAGIVLAQPIVNLRSPRRSRSRRPLIRSAGSPLFSLGGEDSARKLLQDLNGA